MSINIVNIPEIDKEVERVIGTMLHLGYGFRQAHMAMLSVEMNLPVFGLLYELIKHSLDKAIDTFIHFEVSRGKKMRWSEIKPFYSFDGKKPVEIFKSILNIKKDLHLVGL